MKTLKQFHEEFLSHAESRGMSRYTVRSLRYCIGHTIQWLDTTQRVTTPDQFNRSHIELWSKTVRSRRTAKGLPLQINTIVKQFDCDRLFLQWLEHQGALPAGLHKELPRIKVPQLLPTSVLRHEEMEHLLQQIDTTTPDGYQFRAMCELLYTSGVRISELLSLDLDSVDLYSRTARVMGKGKKERIVPFGLTAAKFLEGYLNGIRPLHLADPHEVAFWLDRSGKRMPYHTCRRKMVIMSNQSGLDVVVTLHTFRRSCATVLIRGGANIWHVKELLGHESVETLEPYVRLEINDLRKTHAACHPREKDQENEDA